MLDETNANVRAEASSAPSNDNVASNDSLSTASSPATETNTQANVAQESQGKPQGRMFTREEVGSIAKHTVETERRKWEAERNKQYSTPQSFNPNAYQPNQPQTQQEYEQSLEATRRQIQQIAFEERLGYDADSLVQKIAETMDKHEDFGAVTNAVSDIVNSHTAGVYNALPNAVDVIYHLGRNPEVIPAILYELERNPFDQAKIAKAKVALSKISSQLQANAEAQQRQKANSPVEHEKPTTVTLDSGNRTVSQLRKNPLYRG